MPATAITGDLNQFKDTFLRTHYSLKQLVRNPTRKNAILDQIWTNMEQVYETPVVLGELGTSDHRMVLLVATSKHTLDTGTTLQASIRCSGYLERTMFAVSLSHTRWEYMYTSLHTCEEQFQFVQETMDQLMNKCFPYTFVLRHTTDNPWITDNFHSLVRRRQRVLMSGDLRQFRKMRNMVNRAAPKLRHDFYQSKIASLEDSSSRDWWIHMKSLMGTSTNGSRPNVMQGLANKYTDGDMAHLANTINEFFVSVSDDLPRLQPTHPIFEVSEPLPAEFTISVQDTEAALSKIKVNKAMGPDNIPPWILKEFSQQLATPITAVFNSSLREGILPRLWKSATIIPIPKTHPPESVEKDIRPISLTPIVAKVFESLVLQWVDNIIKPQIDDRQFGGLTGTCTTTALVKMLHKWYEAADELGSFVRVLFLDYSKAFDLINHVILIEKLNAMNIPSHLVRWMAAFLLDREQRVKVGESLSQPA